jgi:HK97 family phage prohead protease
MNTRTLPFEIKSIAETGVIEGVVSAFGHVDHVGDIIQRGAYARSLKQIAETGRKLPLLYQHDPSRPIGVWRELAETQTHLVGRAKLTLETQLAQEAFALAKDGALTGISIGYEVPPGGSKLDGNKRVLTEIDLWEASLVTFPADPKARVTGVKGIASARDIAAGGHFRPQGQARRRRRVEGDQ